MRLPEFIRERLAAWAYGRVAEVDADFIVKVDGKNALLRWHIIPPNPVLSVYLHVVTSDSERDAHDHRSATLSVILDGGYWELSPARWRRWKLFGDRETIWTKRSAGDVHLRGPWRPHRLELWTDGFALTLFITGPTIRRWGFWTADGWVHWKQYVDPNDKGAKRDTETVA